jgi:nicotinate phosphoribosyltransferase
VKIMATNDLDEHLITSLKQQGARIEVWGVGTKLATAYDQPALGGVYKLGAIRDRRTGEWKYKAKVSEQLAKVSPPGVLQVRRFRRGGRPIADAIYSEPLGIDQANPAIVDPLDVTRQRSIEPDAIGEDLLVPILRGGRCVYASPSIHETRQRAIRQVRELHPSIRRFVNPHRYPVGLERQLSDLRTSLLAAARGGAA